MGLFKRDKPGVELPNGCAARADIRENEELSINNRWHDIVRAEMVCPGMPEKGVMPLAKEGYNPYEASNSGRKAALRTVVTQAAQAAVLRCVECPMSTLQAQAEARRAGLLAQAAADKLAAAEALERAQQIMGAMGELNAIGQIGPRQVLDQGSLPPTHQG